MKNAKSSYYLIAFLSIILILKIYLLFLYPREIIFFSTGLSKFNFYNTLSFTIDMQSFRDANHPGTPIYFIGYLIMMFTGNDVKSFYEYFYIHHFIILLFNFCSVGIFFNYFKKHINYIEIFSILLIFISTYNFLFSLEIVSLISYQFGISLILYTYFLKSLEKNKLFKLSIISALAISFKMTFLPYVLSILFTKFLLIFTKKFSLKYFLKFNFSLIFFFLIFNFPIIGRLPRVILDVLFVREDTSISLSNLANSLQVSINELFLNNIIFLLIVIIFILIFIINLFFYCKKIQIDRIFNVNLFAIYIFNIVITIFFIYTFLNAGQVYNLEVRLNMLERENFFRNNFPYLIFIVSNYILFFRLFNFNNTLHKKILIILSIASFAVCLKNYYDFRSELITDKVERKKQLIKKTKSYMDLDNEVLAYFTYSLGYGFGEEIFHLSGNSLEGNEFFTKDIIKIYNNFRYFRLNDILEELKKNDKNDLKISSLKKKLKKFDIILKDNFPKEMYEVLSYQSKNSSLNPLINRSKDLYSLHNNDNYIKPKAILFSHPKINAENFVKEEELFNYVKKRINIIDRVNFKVKDDDWFLYLLK